MTAQLIINGVEVFPIREIKVTYEKKFLDWKKLSVRSFNGTNAFNISKVELEKAIGVIGILGNDILNKSIDAELYIDGVLVDKGNLIIDAYDVRKQIYKVRFVSGLVTFWKNIERKKLNEIIGLSDYNHELSISNFESNMHNDASKPFTYAVAEYGKIDEDGTIVLNYQLPVFFVRWIWRKIIEEAGYNVDVMPNEMEVITPKRGWDSVIDQLQEAWTESVDANEGGNTTDTCMYQDENGMRYYFHRLLWNENRPPHVSPNEFNITNTQNYTLKIEGELRYMFGSFLGFYIYRKDGSGNYTLLDIYQPQYVSGSDYLWNCNYTNTFSLSQGDTIEIWYKSDLICWKEGYRECQVEPGCDPNIEQCDEVCAKYGYNGYDELEGIDARKPNISLETSDDTIAQVNLQALIPDIKQTDFVKEIMIRYGWYLYVDEHTKKVYVKKISDIFETEPQIIRNFEIQKATYYPKDMARENYMRYNYNENDDIDFADGVLEIDNINLPEKKDFLRSQFRASMLGTSFVRIEYFENQGGIPVSVTTHELLQKTFFWQPKRNDEGEITKWEKKGGKPYYLMLVEPSNYHHIFVRTMYGNATQVNGIFWLARMENVGFRHIINNHYRSWWSRIFDNFVEIEVKIFEPLNYMLNFDMTRMYRFEGVAGNWVCASMKYENYGVIKAKFIKVK